MRICSVNSCQSKYRANGFCSRHHQMFRVHGNILNKPEKGARPETIVFADSILIPLGNSGKNGYTKLDREYQYLEKYKWDINERGYATARMNGIAVQLHRHIMNTKRGYVTDHMNLDKLDNRTINLRNATTSQNNANCRVRINNKLGYKGVTVIVSTGKFRAQITKGNYHKNLGHFENVIDAARAYDKAAIKCHGEFARINGV